MKDGELPSSWKNIRIKEVTQIVYGKALQSEFREKEGNVLVYGSSGIVGRHNSLLHEGPSIIIGRKGNVGAIYYVKEPFWCIDTAFYLNNISEAVDIEFLFYILQVANLAQFTKSVAVPGISREDIENLQIPLPLPPEQRYIAAILREADDIRKLRQQANEKTQKIAESLFYDMFGDPFENEKKWKDAKVSELCDLVRGSSPRPQGDPRYFGGPIPRLMIADITRDGLYVTPRIDSLTEEGAKLSRPMSAGSVVMAVSGAPGLPAILDIDSCIHDGFVGFRNLSDRLHPEFFLGFLLGMKDNNNAQAVGVTFQNLKMDQIKSWRVLLPPIELQNHYAELVSFVRDIEKQIKDANQNLDTLYQSLLSQAFTGELTILWRESHLVELVQATEERDRLLKELHGVTKAPVIQQLDKSQVTNREEFTKDLTRLQTALFTLIEARYDTYFTAIRMHEDIWLHMDEQGMYQAEVDREEEYRMFASLDCSLDTIRRELHFIARMGLVKELTLPVEEESGVGVVHYITAYRALCADDDCQQKDLGCLNADLVKEVLA